MAEEETAIENAVGAYFLDHGFFCQKNSKLRTYGNRRLSGPLTLNGAPDLYIIHRGRYIAIEIKTKAGVISDAQKEFKRLVCNAEGLYFIVRSIDDAKVVHKALIEL